MQRSLTTCLTVRLNGSYAGPRYKASSLLYNVVAKSTSPIDVLGHAQALRASSLPSPASRTPPRLRVSNESFRSLRSLELIPEAPDEMFVVEDAAAIADVNVAVDAIE